MTFFKFFVKKKKKIVKIIFKNTTSYHLSVRSFIPTSKDLSRPYIVKTLSAFNEVIS